MTVAAGAVLSGFGKGKFRHVLPDAPLNEDKEVVFDCAPENYCMVDGKLHTFAEMHDQTARECQSLLPQGDPGSNRCLED